MVFQPGRELAAIGIALDIVGAVFLGWGLLRGPSAVASELMTDIIADGEVRPGRRGRTVNTYKIQEFATGMLFGRAGLLLLCLGFGFQLVGLLVPSRQGDWVLPAFFAVFTILVAHRLARRWVRQRSSALAEDILRSPRMSVTGSLTEALNAPRQFTWREPWFVRILGRIL